MKKVIRDRYISGRIIRDNISLKNIKYKKEERVCSSVAYCIQEIECTLTLQISESTTPHIWRGGKWIEIFVGSLYSSTPEFLKKKNFFWAPE